MATSLRSTAARIGESASSAVGGALSGAVTVLGHLRPAAKPMHPRGAVLRATVRRRGCDPATGVPWLDERGEDEALVRFSRGAGLPESWPDVLGLALRVHLATGPADLLFSTAGSGRLGRFVLRPHRARAVAATTYTTLQPYRTPTGAVVLSARPAADRPETSIELAVARPRGAWHAFATVTVDPHDDRSDEPVEFDAVLNEVPGLRNYAWVRRMREGAYAAARRTRR